MLHSCIPFSWWGGGANEVRLLDCVLFVSFKKQPYQKFSNYKNYAQKVIGLYILNTQKVSHLAHISF